MLDLLLLNYNRSQISLGNFGKGEDLVVRKRGGIAYEEKTVRRKVIVECIFLCFYSIILGSNG